VSSRHLRRCSIGAGTLLVTVSLLTGCADSPSNGAVLVVTQVPAGRGDHSSSRPGEPTERYPAGSRVVVITHPGGEVRALSRGLAAAGAPDVAPDGRSVAFAGRRAARWQIYRTTTQGVTPYPVPTPDLDCGDPAWLGGGRLVFACATADGISRHLWVYDPNSRAPKQITFGPGVAFDPSSLADGRILFSLGTADPDRVGLHVVDADGTLFDAFAGIHDGTAREFGARATEEGDVLFVSADQGPPQLERLQLSRPSATRVTQTLNAPDVTAIGSVSPDVTGGFLVAGRNTAGWAIYAAFSDHRPTQIRFDTAEWDEIEAAVAAPWTAPRVRPSALDHDARTGRLLCYDAGRGDGRHGPTASAVPPARVEVRTTGPTAAGSLTAPGVASVAGDGSFWIEVPADVGLRLSTVDDTGHTIARCASIWVRPGEVRACFGCHEGHEAAPRNRWPEAIGQSPQEIVPSTLKLAQRREESR